MSPVTRKSAEILAEALTSEATARTSARASRPGVPGLESRTAPPPSGRDLVKQPLEILPRSDPSSVLPSNTLPVPAAPVKQRLSSQILEMRALRVPHRAVLHEAVALFGRHNVDFIDAYHAAAMSRRGTERVYSYDEDFDRLGVRREEP